MRKTAKFQSLPGLKVFLMAILLHTGASGFTTMPDCQPLSCIITNLQISGSGQNTVTYTWSAVLGATAYKVYYVRLSDGYTSQFYYPSSPTYTSPSLSAGTYRFYFAPVCGNEYPSYIADEIIIT